MAPLCCALTASVRLQYLIHIDATFEASNCGKCPSGTGPSWLRFSHNGAEPDQLVESETMLNTPFMRTPHRLILIVLVSLLAGCATSPTGRTQFILISPDAAILESETAYLDTVRQLDDEDKLVNDPLTVARVARITGRLVSIAVKDFPESADWKWSVAIVDDTETVNAWCMAGGRMAVYTVLFDQLGLTDDEFA